MSHACPFFLVVDADSQHANAFFQRPGLAPQVLSLRHGEHSWAATGLREASAEEFKAASSHPAMEPKAAEGLWADWVASLASDHANLFRQPDAFVPGQSSIAPSGKVVGAKEAELMTRSALESWLTTGRFNDQFEKRIAKMMDRKWALTVNSGSSANLVALSTFCSPQLGDRALKAGDEVITAAAGFPTTVNPMLNNGLVPVFVDSEDSGNIDASLIEAAIGPKTRAIMAAHTLGNPMRMDVIMDVAKRHNLFVIEDCCDAFGATFNNQLVGTFGDMATLSFYPAHHITMGEGGAVFPSTREFAKIAESVRDWGRDCYCAPGCDNTCGKRFGWQLGQLPAGYDHKYTYSNLGYNLKISDMQAACGLAQLDRAEGFIESRRVNHAKLVQKMRDLDLEQYFVLPEATPNSNPSWFGFLLRLRPEAETMRKDLIDFLEQRKIMTRLLFAGNLTRQPYFEGRPWRQGSDLKMADTLMNDAFWVGIWPGLGDAQLDWIADSVAAYFGLGW